MAERSYPTNVVQLDPEANSLVLQIAAARAQLAQDVSEKIRTDLDNFKVEVRGSLRINADMVAEAIHKLEKTASKCDAISERLVTRLTVLEGRALQRTSQDDIIVSIAETNLAEQRLELERGRQDLEREKEARAQAKEDRDRKWGLVKQWSATLSSSAVVLAVIAFIAQKC